MSHERFRRLLTNLLAHHANRQRSVLAAQFLCPIPVGYVPLGCHQGLKIPYQLQSFLLIQDLALQQPLGKTQLVWPITNHNHHPFYRQQQPHHGESYSLNYEWQF